MNGPKVPKFSIKKILTYWSNHKNETCHYSPPFAKQNLTCKQTKHIDNPHPPNHSNRQSHTTNQKNHLSLSLNMAEEKQKHSGSGAGGGIVAVDPKPNNGLTSKVIDFVEKLIVKLLYDSSLPHHYLSGNFAPVREETPPTTDLLVKGHLPVRTIILFFSFFFSVLYNSLQILTVRLLGNL